MPSITAPPQQHSGPLHHPKPLLRDCSQDQEPAVPQHSCGRTVTSGGTQLRFCSCSRGTTGTKTTTCLAVPFPSTPCLAVFPSPAHPVSLSLPGRSLGSDSPSKQPEEPPGGKHVASPPRQREQLRVVVPVAIGAGDTLPGTTTGSATKTGGNGVRPRRVNSGAALGLEDQ